MQRVASEQRRKEKLVEQSKDLTERLNQVTLTFKARVGSQGRLYGSITSQDIASALRDVEKLTIDRRSIELSEPIRTPGTFIVPIKVASGLESKVTINVIDEAAIPA
jgi:large subunit ribosomal protein L9